jgi:transposase, IS5 family
MRRRSFASVGLKGVDFATHGRATGKARFLVEMNELVPWASLCELIEPHYPKAGNGRPAAGLERMLRIHFLQCWFNLTDEACEEALYDMALFREFAMIDLGEERVPDATTMLKFRRLLERHDLSRAIFDRVNALLADRGLTVSGGTMVDATLIHAPSSTKNESRERDPEMHQVKKGNQYYFVHCVHLASRDRRKRRPAACRPGGMKLHIGADTATRLIHSAQTTAANVHDSQVLPDLLHGEERRVYGDSAYRGQKTVMSAVAPKAKDFTNERARRNAPLSERQKAKNRAKSAVRAAVEYPFLHIKRLWGYAKTRYRGLKKNTDRLITMCALYNIRHARIVLAG